MKSLEEETRTGNTNFIKPSLIALANLLSNSTQHKRKRNSAQDSRKDVTDLINMMMPILKIPSINAIIDDLVESTRKSMASGFEQLLRNKMIDLNVFTLEVLTLYIFNKEEDASS